MCVNGWASRLHTASALSCQAHPILPVTSCCLSPGQPREHTVACAFWLYGYFFREGEEAEAAKELLLNLQSTGLHLLSGACQCVPLCQGRTRQYPLRGCFVRLKLDLTVECGFGWFGPCDPELECNYYCSVNCFNFLGWGGGGRRKIEVTHSSKRTGRKECVERFSVSLQIYKNKQTKKHFFQIKMTTFLIWQKVVYT